MRSVVAGIAVVAGIGDPGTPGPGQARHTFPTAGITDPSYNTAPGYNSRWTDSVAIAR